MGAVFHKWYCSDSLGREWLNDNLNHDYDYTGLTPHGIVSHDDQWMRYMLAPKLDQLKTEDIQTLSRAG